MRSANVGRAGSILCTLLRALPRQCIFFASLEGLTQARVASAWQWSDFSIVRNAAYVLSPYNAVKDTRNPIEEPQRNWRIKAETLTHKYSTLQQCFWVRPARPPACAGRRPAAEQEAFGRRLSK